MLKGNSSKRGDINKDRLSVFEVKNKPNISVDSRSCQLKLRQSVSYEGAYPVDETEASTLNDASKKKYKEAMDAPLLPFVGM